MKIKYLYFLIIIVLLIHGFYFLKSNENFIFFLLCYFIQSLVLVFQYLLLKKNVNAKKGVFFIHVLGWVIKIASFALMLKIFKIPEEKIPFYFVAFFIPYVAFQMAEVILVKSYSDK